MLGLLLRIVFAGLLLLGAWKALGLYALYRYGEHMRHCLAQSDSCRIVAAGQPAAVLRSMARDIACVRQRQPWYESLALGTPRIRPGDDVQAAQVSEVEVNRAGLIEMCKDWGPDAASARRLSPAPHAKVAHFDRAVAARRGRPPSSA